MGYVLIAFFSFLGMKRSDAEQYVYLPFTALATFVAVGLAQVLVNSIPRSLLHIQLSGLLADLVGLVEVMLISFLGRDVLATRGLPLKASQGREAVVFEGTKLRARRDSSAERYESSRLPAGH